MNQVSPEGPNWSYRAERDSFSDEQRFLRFALFMAFGPEPEPTEATDEQVRAAIADLEQREPAEATDEQVREIFADEGPEGRTARPPAAIGTTEADQ